jgi:hypothetical protein
MDLASKSSRADIWRERIMSQQASGQSVRAWCRENAACPEHSFYWWRARLNLGPDSARRRGVAKAQAPAALAQTIPFAEVLVTASAQPICLRLASGRELLLPASMAVEQIARLVSLIEAHSTSSGKALP